MVRRWACLLQNIEKMRTFMTAAAGLAPGRALRHSPPVFGCFGFGIDRFDLFVHMGWRTGWEDDAAVTDDEQRRTSSLAHI